MRAPRFDGCRHCGERLIASPVSELLPERVSPELRHLQAELVIGMVLDDKAQTVLADLGAGSTKETY